MWTNQELEKRKESSAKKENSAKKADTIIEPVVTKVEQNRLDAFQNKGLRRICGIPPTHIDRTATNKKVIETMEKEHK